MRPVCFLTYPPGPYTEQDLDDVANAPVDQRRRPIRRHRRQ